jgi:hypothetical protein
MKHRVRIDDSLYYMDESERAEHGVYESAAEALEVVRTTRALCRGMRGTERDERNA